MASLPWAISRLLGVALPALVLSGCAVHYFDADTDTEHIWGIGHMAMKPGTSNQGVKALGHRTDVVGLSTGKTREGVHLELGWSRRQRIEIVDESTQLCLEWPESVFYDVRVGTEFPPDLDACVADAEEETP